MTQPLAYTCQASQSGLHCADLTPRRLMELCGVHCMKFIFAMTLLMALGTAAVSICIQHTLKGQCGLAVGKRHLKGL